MRKSNDEISKRNLKLWVMMFAFISIFCAYQWWDGAKTITALYAEDCFVCGEEEEGYCVSEEERKRTVTCGKDEEPSCVQTGEEVYICNPNQKGFCIHQEDYAFSCPPGQEGYCQRKGSYFGGD